MKLAAYVRVSTERQADEGLGLEVQEKALRRLARDQKHRIVSWHRDEGISGSNGVETRVGLYGAIEAIKEGQADGLLAYNLDRLARKLTVQEAILGHVWDAGGAVLTVEDGGVVAEDDPDDPMRTAMRQMRGVFAQLERGLISKRMRDGRRLKSEKGGYAYGAPPFGFRSRNGTLEPDEDEQAALDRIHELRRDGNSLREIADQLALEGFRPKRSDQWHVMTLSRILRREANVLG